MGVSGSGKTSVGILLAKSLSIPFYDADDYHNCSSIQKMKKGVALNDSDRIPWLKLLSSKIIDWNLKGDSVLACSALKEKYRNLLSKNNKVAFIFLDGSYDLIYERLAKRKNHFFRKKMLEEQFTILEKPIDCITIPINQSVENICLMISSNLKKQNK
jgi:gluconokinase